MISLPYLWAIGITPPGFVYSGILNNPDDQNVHLAWAKQAAEGHFFFRDLFTTESLVSGERPLFTNLLCWLIGICSAITTIPIIWWYHAFRIVFAVLTIFLFFILTTKATADRRVRITATALAAFSGGAGFLAPLLPNINWIDRPTNPSFPMMPEAFTFASAMNFTLNITSMALMLGVYLLVLKAWESGSRKAAAGAGVCTLLLANIHTYDVFPLLLTLAAWALVARLTPAGEGKHRRHYAFLPFVAIGAAIPVLYQFFVFYGSEEFRVKALTRTPPPQFLDLAISYGPLFLLAVAGIIVTRNNFKFKLFFLWAIATLNMIYIPVSFARKMIEGIHLPLCLLAAVGLVWLIGKLQPNLQRVLALAVVLIMSISTFQFVAWTLDNARDNNNSRANVFMPPLYLDAGYVAALDYLNEQPRGKVVLCLPFVGNHVPRATGQTVYIGHWAETLNFGDKLGAMSRFFGQGMSVEEARTWLRENRINYIMTGSYEEIIGVSLPLELPVVHQQGNTTIYAVP